MYDKLEELKYYIEETELNELNKNYMIDIIDDIEREMEINEATCRYLEDYDE